MNKGVLQHLLLGAIGLLSATGLQAQHKKHHRTDSVQLLKEVTVVGYKTVNGIGHLLEQKDGIVYAGKKTEVLLIDSLDANKVINNTRQILGRIPGLNIVETESSGFTANGIATRGLNPSQSIEMNVRQNGYNISADVYGYNEAYYIPPMEAVKRIELIRGAAGLQFGAQFGGVVNYITDDAPVGVPYQITISQTKGSYGLYNIFNSIGGHYNKWSYYAFLQHRTMDGYRPNSAQTQTSAFAKLQYRFSDKVVAGLEYSLLRNRIQMPGGLTDSMFAANPKLSVRARNWLKSPWNVLHNYINVQAGKQFNISIKNSFVFSGRSLVWRNEDGGPAVLDTIDPLTGQLVPREVEKETMRSFTTELRGALQYRLGKQQHTLATGVRAAHVWFERLGGGEGTTGSDFDLGINGAWEYSYRFTTTNIAPFAENIFSLGKQLTFTPGIRVEYLRNTANGYTIDDVYKISVNKTKNRYFVLAGAGMEYKPRYHTSLYANISQAYRPVDYSQQQPFGVTSKVDSAMKDAKGWNADIGYRTSIKNYLNVDVSLFYLAYNNRIGEIVLQDATGNEYGYRTNIANSIHKGVEAYIEWNIAKCFYQQTKWGWSLFQSIAYTDARYTSGPYKGNRVETAAKVIWRSGTNITYKGFSATLQMNYTSDAYGDAANVRVSDNPIAGYIPAYTVWDLSGAYKFSQFAIRLGINNLFDKAYFTRRTDEYPGPGIIPAVGRSAYLGFSIKI